MGWRLGKSAPKDGREIIGRWGKELNARSYGIVRWEDGRWYEESSNKETTDPIKWHPMPEDKD